MARTKGKYRYIIQQLHRFTKTKEGEEEFNPAASGAKEDPEKDVWVDLSDSYENHSDAQRSIKTHRRKGVFRTASVSPLYDGVEEAPKEPVYVLKERSSGG